ncbi:peptide deformylase [Buchnera aphidicola (Mollitrichosiphum nigrofasciatum)]|uniref:peptide deformylase n=1 Tax=Buchnera aphidicola TaxID=9 RepID=UPI0031B80EAC
MTILKILKYPNKKLRIVAKPVKKINFKIQKKINNMLETMQFNEGIGLAATQVNINLQIAVIGRICNIQTPIILINPKIIQKKGEIYFKERCLSLPNKKATIKRAKYIIVSAINYYGKKQIIHAKSILSVCIQHELDHLIGKLFIDYI